MIPISTAKINQAAVGIDKGKTYICYMTIAKAYFGYYFYYFFYGKRPGLLLLTSN